MPSTNPRMTSLPSAVVTALATLFFLLGGTGSAVAFDFHTESAHGNNNPVPGYGVNRSGTGYGIGDCTHCHDTFDDSICGVNSLMLFSTPLYIDQWEGFCLECHRSPGTSLQANMPNQYGYATTFGGDTATCPGNIRAAFRFIKEGGNTRSQCGTDKGSAHHLTSIRDFLQGRWGFGDVLANINPCEGCHDKHKAQQHNYPVGSDGTSPISLPSTHDDSNWEIWGDGSSERMDSYASPLTYQAPYYYYNEGGYEPEGNNTYDGSNLPDYVTFCTDCHNSSNTIWSNELGRNLYTFDWATEKHGKGAASDNPNYYDLRSPYSESQAGNYVLSCLDCHEPHGASNSFLTRPMVNGWWADLTEGSPNDWRDWCRRCHNQMSHLPVEGPHDTGLGCTTCHNPGPLDYTCSSSFNRCHTHGSAVGGL